MIELTVQHAQGAAGAVTTRALRSVHLDTLAREAVSQLEGPVIAQPDIAPHAYSWPGAPGGTYMAQPPPGTRWRPPADRVAEAAQVYSQAVAEGSRSPTLAVAAEAGYSRSQASRLIRQARDRGLIPPAGEAGAQAAAEWPVRVDPVADPLGDRHRGPDIFLDPNASHPARPARKRRADERKDT